MFLVNSRQALFTAASSGLDLHPHPNEAPLLPKLRGQFAEFLGEGSPERLSIFYSPTSVGLRYGHLNNSLRGFSRQCEITRVWPYGLPRHASALRGKGFASSLSLDAWTCKP